LITQENAMPDEDPGEQPEQASEPEPRGSASPFTLERRTAARLVLVGGVAVVAGSLLPHADTGIVQSTYGGFATIVGVILVLAGFLQLDRRPSNNGRAVTAIVALVGLGIVAAQSTFVETYGIGAIGPEHAVIAIGSIVALIGDLTGR
jgi:peptidoglycan/LPS O-acetylase OafA/YrhL